MPSDKLDDTAAGRLSKKVHLRNVSFFAIEASYVGAPSAHGDLLDWTIPQVVGLWEREDADVKILFPFSVVIDAIDPAREAVRSRIVEIRVSIRLDYQIDSESAASVAADLPHFLGVCGYLHAWPYLRSEVQFLSNKIGLPPLVLPTIVSGTAVERVTVKEVKEIEAQLKRLVDAHADSKKSLPSRRTRSVKARKS